jgi:hypothetical protein
VAWAVGSLFVVLAGCGVILWGDFAVDYGRGIAWDTVDGRARVIQRCLVVVDGRVASIRRVRFDKFIGRIRGIEGLGCLSVKGVRGIR